VTPALPATHVGRARLVRRLDESVAHFIVTLVAGFPGSGKTVLLAEFARARPTNSVAWLSCDVTDSDPVQFWNAVVAALRTFDPNIGTEALDLLDADGRFGHEAIASLVNDLFDLDGDHVLVIDDLDLVARSALESLGELLERISLSLRVVLSARSDPRLPLHRWRAGGRLGELRAPELRMDADEVRELVRMVGVEVLPEDATVLADRTEGWAAGVQLAALSMRHEARPAEFIRGFAGTDRNVSDYLIGEVLRRQSADTVDFLLETSVLDELCAPLCDVLTERADSGALLHRLERENLFVVALENDQERYRYHHLFAELLRRMLTARQLGRLPALHRTASEWYGNHDDARRALRHAILSQDPILLTRLLRGLAFGAYFTGASEMVRDWISDLRRSHRDMPAELLVEYALALLYVGAIDDAGACLGGVDPARMDAPSARARLAVAYALLFAVRGETEPAIGAAEHARALVGLGVDPSVDGILHHVLLRCYVNTDDLIAARAEYERALAHPNDFQALDLVVLRGAFSQAELEAGELEAARNHAQTAAADTATLGGEAHVGFSEALRTLASIEYEHDRLD